MNAKDVRGMVSEEMEIVRLLQKYQVMSKEELIQWTGIKSTTINRIIEQLRQRKIIVVCGEGDSTGGRKPLLYGLNRELRLYTVGFSIALHHLDVAVFSFLGKPVFSHIVVTNHTISPREAVRIIADGLEKRLAEHGIGKDQILGCGLSASPSMDRERGLLVKSLSFSFSDPAWVDFPVRRALEEATGLRILIMDTAANAGCIGEYLYGYGRSHSKVLNLICGNGIRVGCIANDRLVRPTNDLDDAFGHMVIVANGEPCDCGNYGCIDCYATGRVIQRYYVDELKKGRGDSRPIRELDNTAIIKTLKAAESGDALAAESVCKAASMLGIGLANYINLINPDIVTCAGYVVEESELYYRTLVEVATKKISCLGFSRNTVFTKLSDMGKAVFGASIMAMEAVFDRFY